MARKTNSIYLTRTLPIADHTYYLGKVGFSLSMLLASEIPSFIFLIIYFSNQNIYLYLDIVAALYSFSTALTLFLILKFGTRITFIVINVPTEILIYLWRTFEDDYPDKAEEIIASQAIFILGSILLLAGTYIFYRLGVSYFEKRDTQELVT